MSRRLVDVSSSDPPESWWNRRIVLRRDAGGYYAVDDRMHACADARLSYGWTQHNGPDVEAYGSSVVFTSATDVTGTSVDGSTARFTRVADPDDAAKWCWRWRTNSDDPDTGGTGNRRGEFAFIRGTAPFYENNPRVIGFCARVQDWKATMDDQIFFQIHAPSASLVASPWLAFQITAGVFRVLLIYDVNATPSGSTAVAVTLYSDANWTPDQWMRFAVLVREDYRGGGVVQVLKDGVEIVDYAGPVGYNNISVGASYVKNGYYHWTGSGNDWDASLATRVIYEKGAYIAGEDVSLPEMDGFLSEL